MNMLKFMDVVSTEQTKSTNQTNVKINYYIWND